MIDEDAPWPDVSCALPDLRYALVLVLGAVVVGVALMITLARKLRPW